MAKKKKLLPPKTHEEGVQRVIKLTEYLYDFQGSPEIMAKVLVDATYTMIDRVNDPDIHHRTLERSLELAYDRLKDKTN